MQNNLSHLLNCKIHKEFFSNKYFMVIKDIKVFLKHLIMLYFLVFLEIQTVKMIQLFSLSLHILLSLD